MKRALILASLLLVFFAAYFSSRTLDLAVVEAEGEISTKDRTPAGRLSARDGVNGMGFRGYRPEDYRAAWDDIPGRRLRTIDREALQIEVLKAWGEVDLEGAVATALGENWNPGVGRSAEHLLGAAFGEVFKERPFEVWEKIKAGSFGELESALVRTAWVRVMMGEDPETILPLLGELDPMNQQRLVSEVLNATMSADDLRGFWKRLQSVNDGAIEMPLLRILSGAKLKRVEILEFLDKGGLIARNAAGTLALQVPEDSLSVASLEVAQSLPEEVQGEFVSQLMLRAETDHELAKAALDRLVEMGDWERAGGEKALAVVKDLSQLMEPWDLASWAVALPQRDEAKDLFDRGIEPYLGADRDAAWDWIGRFEEGMWRDRAYAEFSQQSLYRFDDPVKSDEALNQIKDPAFKDEAAGWRKVWENQPRFRD